MPQNPSPWDIFSPKAKKAIEALGKPENARGSLVGHFFTPNGQK